MTLFDLWWAMVIANDGCKAAKLQLEMIERELETDTAINIRGFCTPVALDLGPEGGKVR